ncbi:MAG: hypothetical protein ACK5CA_13585 [Cyanobacteriota bacterium]|jgi:hypothetical protein
MQITLDIPDDIAQQLQPLQGDLTQILALGIRQLNANPATGFSGLAEILEFLAQLPSPQQILDLRLAPETQAEIDALLEKNCAQGLNEAEQRLWQQYEFMEHLVRLAKAQALLKLQLHE